MIVKLLTEHHLEFLSFKGGCTGSFESTHVKIPHCRKSHATAHLLKNRCSTHLRMKFQLFIQCCKSKSILALKLSNAVFILLINVKMPTTVCIYTFMSGINFKPSRDVHEKI